MLSLGMYTGIEIYGKLVVFEDICGVDMYFNDDFYSHLVPLIG